ncbi:DMT family transporter [Polycladidibacter hongkongensis]|uniref:DMT family transporter n=1 Tax=Polycladidibacter hongkongensis TaxID=1647556 RepID=UPI0009E9F3CA|nr:DMT family transporter [Pseudovibrio hongkongensis]
MRTKKKGVPQSADTQQESVAGDASKPKVHEHRQEANPLLGIGCKIAATLMFFVMAACIKLVGEEVPTGQVVFSRNLFAMLPIFAMLLTGGNIVDMARTQRPLGHLLRAAIGVSAMICVFTAYELMSLPDVTAIGFASPLIVVALAALLLGEKVRAYRWSAVVLGFTGVLITMWPHLGQSAGSSLGVLAAVGAAFLSACAMITVRQLCVTERATTVVLWFTVFSALLTLLTLPLGLVIPEMAWVVPDWRDALILLVLGISGGVGQILLTQSYRYADASTIAPFDYVNMLWALLFGFLLFDEVPSGEVLIGTAIVIGAGIFVIFREKRLGYDRGRQGRASTPFKV